MKKFILAMSMLFAINAYATTPEEAIEAFQNSPEVQHAIEQYKALSLMKFEETEVDAVLLGSGCGFAGCSYQYLVVQGLATSGINPQSTSITAFVTMTTYGSVKVELVEIRR